MGNDPGHEGQDGNLRAHTVGYNQITLRDREKCVYCSELGKSMYITDSRIRVKVKGNKIKLERMVLTPVFIFREHLLPSWLAAVLTYCHWVIDETPHTDKKRRQFHH